MAEGGANLVISTGLGLTVGTVKAVSNYVFGDVFGGLTGGQPLEDDDPQPASSSGGILDFFTGGSDTSDEALDRLYVHQLRKLVRPMGYTSLNITSSQINSMRREDLIDTIRQFR